MAQEWTFEKAMARLEQIVAALESGKCTLDESLKLFEEGTKLTGYCSKALKTAEQKIVKLTAADVSAAQNAAGAEQTPEDAGKILDGSSPDLSE